MQARFLGNKGGEFEYGEDRHLIALTYGRHCIRQGEHSITHNFRYHQQTDKLRNYGLDQWLKD